MDDDDWTWYARKHMALAANELISLRDPSRRVPWRKLIPPRLHPSVRWGKRKRRTGRRDVASPQTPLEFSFNLSHGGSSAGEKRSDGDGLILLPVTRPSVETKVEPAPPRKPIRARKKTLPELQEEERSLLGERQGYQKLLEAKRNTLQVLVETNERLRRTKLILQLERAVVTSEELQPRNKAVVALPDLNELPDLNDQVMQETS
ncbi:hypothetical protein IHE45_09G017300 [Dioscorea alata]|uniref:Uncharacterized protein n=1 Tax=Dioscorea alata TaxID=55571 RepID=A0ACB7VDJ8_DIOAL|nr:hypothetical protein IHE45_09G017300 [Dioscorea alata]